MYQYCQQQKIYNGGKSEYYFFTWSIPEVSLISDLNVSTECFKIVNDTYKATLCSSKDKIIFRIESTSRNLKCFVSVIIGSKTLLLSNSLSSYTSTGRGSYLYYDLVTLSSDDENFQKLKQNPNNTLALICKIKYPVNISTESAKGYYSDSTDSLYNLKSLAAVLGNSSESFLKEKVILQVGEETETVSKAVLCARSPVFAKMFENDMREGKENMVTVTDIKMPILKELVSYFYTGKLSRYDFDSLCEIYYAADKYDVMELRQICVDILTRQISMENIHRVMKLAFSHNDEVLKSTVVSLIATNIKTWFSTNDWKNLINDEPKIAAEVLNFFDF